MRLAVLIAMVILLATPLAGCVKQEGAPLTLQTTEEEIESLRALLNNQNLGKFKVIKEQYAFGAVAYSIVVYADYYEGIQGDVDELIGRLFASTAQLSEMRYIGVRAVSIDTEQIVYETSKIEELRAHPEDWKSLSETSIWGLVLFSTSPKSPTKLKLKVM